MDEHLEPSVAPSAKGDTPRRALVTLMVVLLLLAPASNTLATEQWASRIVEGYDGVPLVVHEWGSPDGIPVLMLHGFSFGASAFSNQEGDIARYLRFIAPDLRGHGLSAKPWRSEAYAGTEVWAEDLARIIEAFELENPVIMGWSFGGYVALNYLRHCGSQCASGLVLAGSLAGIVPTPPRPDAKELGLPPPRGNSRVDNYAQLFDNAEWVARVMTFNPAPAGDTLERERTIVMMPPMVRRAMTDLALDNQDLASSLDLPVLFIHGEKDASVPPAAVAAALDELPDGDSLMIPGSGHSPFAENTALFNEALLEFVQEVYPSP